MSFAILAGLDGYSIEIRGLRDWEVVAKHNFTKQVADVEVISDKLLLLTASKRLHILSLPELETLPVSKWLRPGEFRMESASQLGDGWLLGGAWLDSTLSKPLSISSLDWSGLKQFNRSRAPQPKPVVSELSRKRVYPGPSYFRGPWMNNSSGNVRPIRIADTVYSVEEQELGRSRERIAKLISSAGPFGDESVNLASYQWSYASAWLTHAKDTTMLTANGQIYTFRLAEISGLEQPLANDLTLRAKSLVSKISPRRSTSIPLEVTGGSPPYAITAEFHAHDRLTRRPIEGSDVVTSTENAVAVDGKKIQETFFTFQHDHQYEGFFKDRFFNGRIVFDESYTETMEEYVKRVSDELNSYAGHADSRHSVWFYGRHSCGRRRGDALLPSAILSSSNIPARI